MKTLISREIILSQKGVIELPDLEGAAAISLPDDTLAYRNELVRVAREDLPIIANHDWEAVKITGWARKLQTEIVNAEKVGKELRDQVRPMLNRILELEREFVNPLKDEKARLQRILGIWDEQERQRVAAEEKARQLEIQRLAAEKALADKLAAEAIQQAAPENRLNVIAEAESLRLEASDAHRMAVVAPLPEKRGMTGASSRQVLKHEVKDIALVYKTNPHLCRPLEISPAAIKAVCIPKKEASKETPDADTYPGLAVWWENDMSVRRL